MIETHPYLQHFHQLKPTFVGNDLMWLRALREKSLHQFLAKGFPSRTKEAWKYTDLTFLTEKPVEWSKHNETLTQEQLESFRLPEESLRLVFVDGNFSLALSDTIPSDQEIKLLPLSEGLLTTPDRLKSYLENDQTPAQCRLVQLNTAFLTDGVFLNIPKNTILEKPLHLLFISTPAFQDGMAHLRHLITLSENSRATILEQHIALETNNGFKNTVTKIFTERGAQLDYYKLQQESLSNIHLARTEIAQDQDSRVTHHSISLGAALSRDTLNVALNQPGAQIELNGFYAPSGTQHIDHHTRIDHKSPHGESRECYKGLLQDKAVGVFNGKVIVHPHAQKTNSQQLNNNLLLSKTAQMNTKPELEIYADDVKCTHGATVGQLEPEALFYLRSRGLDEASAITLLTHAFCEEVLARITHDVIGAYVRDAVKKKTTHDTTR